MFIRKIMAQLKDWKSKKNRKPLLLMGARQIGKTTTLKEFGSQQYDNFLYLNFEKQQDIHEFFTKNKDPRRIIENLSLIHGQDIVDEKTLIIFDEIQECRDALIALKYFQEEVPHIHIIGAGSLLGLTIGNNRSFPVGKVEFLDMYPLTFSEYLQKYDTNLYVAYEKFKTYTTPLPQAFFNPLKQSFKEYLLFGGMPEVAAHYILHRDITEAHALQDQILRAYQLDFVKHASKTTSTKIQHIWNAIPSQLAKENKKFIYKVVRSGARAREYEEAIEWLSQAGLVYKTLHIEKPGIPLKAYQDTTAFKIYLFDTSLLIRLSNLDPKSFISGDQFFTEFKGSLAENHVARSLYQNTGKNLHYWTSSGTAELDFIVEHRGEIIPVEVKSGAQTKAKSLSIYQQKYNPNIRVRVSELNLSLTDNLLNIPLFYADEITHLLENALKTLP